MSFTSSSHSIRLSENILYAECCKNDESYTSSSPPLDLVLGNINGTFKWGYKNFSQSARNIELGADGCLRARLQDENGQWRDAEMDLNKEISNKDGVLVANDVMAIIAIPSEDQTEFLEQLATKVDEGDVKIQVMDEEDGSATFYVNAGVQQENGTIFKTWTADARAAVVHTVQSKGRPIEQVNVDVFSANASASVSGIKDGTGGIIPTYAGIDASVNLVKAEASIFDLTLGAGVETGIGLKDGSWETKVAGCGITIGKKIGISVFGSSFGIDLGRLF